MAGVAADSILLETKSFGMISFEKLADKARAFNPDVDTDLLRRAYDFSATEHAGQRRRSGEPYLTHPIEVAAMVAGVVPVLASTVATGEKPLPVSTAMA